MSNSFDANRDFYNRNASAFIDRTKNLDMEQLYRPFLSCLEPGARVLDAGCGSGRDIQAFTERGYRVIGVDLSKALVQFAREHTRQEVHHLALQEVTREEEFDGVWACASLLHIPELELPGVLQRLQRSLRSGGVMYMSFKYGQGERELDGRLFTDLDEKGLRTRAE